MAVHPIAPRVVLIALALVASHHAARAEPSPEVIFAELRDLQSQGRFVECIARGREAAPGLVDLEVVWLIVAECEASERRWCDASGSVARFLASGGASEARMAAARRLEAESLARCTEARSAAECVAANDRGDWAGCADACMRAGDVPLPEPRSLLTARCLLRAGSRCAEAEAILTNADRDALDDEDQDRLDACASGEAAPGVVVSSPGNDGAATSAAAPWLLGVGGVAVVTGVVLLLVADGTADDMAALPQGPDYLTRYAELERDHRTQLIGGHVATWTGLAIVGTGVVFLVLDGDDPRVPRPSLAPTLTPDGLGMSLNGRF